MTEAQLIAFVGWLTTEREAGRRKRKKCFNAAVLQCGAPDAIGIDGHTISKLYPPRSRGPSLLALGKNEFPQSEFRCGILAAIFQAIWRLGMATISSSLLKYSAMVFLAYSRNGLHDSSLTSLLASNIELTNDEGVLRLKVMKEKQASRV